MISDYDRANFTEIIGGHGDWFTAHLLRLIAKSDREHRARLRLGFPDEVAAFEKWMEEPLVAADYRRAASDMPEKLP